MTPNPARLPHDVLHQLRSPVAAIIGYAELLTRTTSRGDVPREKLLHRLARIHDSANRINTLLDELEHLPEFARAPRDG